MIYDINGNNLLAAYDKNKKELLQVYDINGNGLIEFLSTLVVMSYNVQKFSGLNANISMQKSIVDIYKPDIVGMQELGANTTLPSVGATVFENYLYQYLGPDIVNRPGIVSKINLANVTSTEFMSQANEHRGYQKAYFERNGKTICWVNAHLETSSNEAIKVAQAGEIFSIVQNEPYFIITGDFNTTCKSVNDAEYTTIMKQFVDAGYNVANCSEQFGFTDTWTSGSTASGTWYPCDHIITSVNIEMDRVIVDTTKIDIASQTGQSIDHLPIIAYLTVT